MAKWIDDSAEGEDQQDRADKDRILQVTFTTEKRVNQAAMNRIAEMNEALEERAVLLDAAHKFDDGKAAREEKISEDPIYRDIEFVSIRVPGNVNWIHRPVMPADKRRFADSYRKFKDGRGEEIEGTPLARLTNIKDSQITDLEYMKVSTIEGLAGIADSSPLMSLMGVRPLREQAIKHVARNRKNTVVTQTNAALAERDEKIASLEEKLQQLVSVVESQRATPAKTK